MRRNTAQRTIILNTLQKTHNHPPVEWIYEEVRKILPHVSLATVYRNLNVLKEEGLVREVILDGQKSYFDGNVTPHAHFVCDVCGTISDIELPQQLINPVLDLAGYTVKEIRIDYHGVCPTCQQ